MHRIGLWWRQPDHYDWLSDYLGARGLKPFVRYLLAAILTNLAAATLLMLISSSGPQTPMRRAVAVAFVVSLAAMALVWLLSWPTRFQSQMFSIAGAVGIAAICVIDSDPRSGMLGCAAFGGLAGYVAFFHSARLLVFTLGSALGTTLVCAARIAVAGDASMAAAKLMVLSAGILAVPFCGQILVHWLSVDALKSSTDPLTGLRNRRGFYRSASKLFAAEMRTHCLSVVMLDLDNFKRINDTHGHATGDRILVAVADTLRRIGGAATVIARVGGEEFLVAEHIGTREALRTAEAMRLAIAATPWGVTASLGVSSIALSSEHQNLDRKIIERLVEAADAAMYEAKRAGGDQVRHADIAALSEIADDGTGQPIGTLEHLDPAILEIGDNVRDDAALSKAFIAGIAENGVLVPITGVRNPDNPAVVRVRNGQRRTLAAREVGLATVPVYVLPPTAADASQDTIDRIVHQIVTNDQKQDLTDAQRARGIQQMIDAGMSVTKAAKIHRTRRYGG